MTGNPHNDAQDYLHRLDFMPSNNDYTCVCCEEGFDKGKGVQIEDERFCEQCIANNEHLHYYMGLGLDAADIYKITNQLKQI